MKNIQNSMLQRFAGRRTVVFLGLLLFIATSCRDDDKLLGSAVQPDGELVALETIDSFTVHAYNVDPISIRTDEVTNYVGQIITSQMGTTRAGFTANFGISTPNPFFRPEEYRVDSVILRLDPALFWGDSPVSLPLEVYPLREVLSEDDDYMSDYPVSFDFQRIGAATVTLSSNDSLRTLATQHLIDEDSIVRDTIESWHRIKLDNLVGEQILFGWGVEYQDEEEFKNYFPGIHVKVDESALSGLSPGFINYALTSTHSGIYLYTNYDTEVREPDLTTPDVDTDSITVIKTLYDLEFLPIRASGSARFNTFEHDYAGSELETFRSDSGNTTQPLFIQGFAGSRAEITFPHLEKFVNENDGIVSKATLEFELADVQPDELFDPAERLFLITVDFQDVNPDPDIQELEEIERFSLDYLFSTPRYGGTYDSENNKYVFDVTREMQSAIERSQVGQFLSPGFRLARELYAINGHQNVPSETVLKGSENITLKLHITPLNP